MGQAKFPAASDFPNRQNGFNFNTGTAVSLGDLLYISSGNTVVPAASLSALGSDVLDRDAYTALFAGVAMDTRNASDPTVPNFPVATVCAAEYDCTATTWVIGDLVGNAEQADNAGLEKQKVAKVTDPAQAIGYCVLGGTSLTRVSVLLFSKITPLGIPGSSVGKEPINVTASTLTVTDAHANKTVTLNRAAGQAITLAPAVGSGKKYRFVVGTTITSNSTAFTAAGSDKLQGVATVVSDDSGVPLKGYGATASTSFTMDGTTQGGYVGHVIEFEDIGAALYQVNSLGMATGTEKTPFA